MELYSIATDTPTKLESVPTGIKSLVRGMAVDVVEMILFILTDEGVLVGLKYDNESTHPKFNAYIQMEFKESMRSMKLLPNIHAIILGT